MTKPLALAGLLSCLSMTAAATSGEPTFIEVLGYDEADQKIYWSAQAYPPPRVFFIRLDKPSAAVEVKSFSDNGRNEDAIPKRISHLRKRLKAMKKLASSPRKTEAERYGSTLPPGIVYLGTKRTVLRRWKDPEYETPCREVSLALRRAKPVRSGSLKIVECGQRARVTAVYSVPGRDELLAIVSSKPFVWEGGYEVQRAVLLRAHPTAHKLAQ